MTWFTKKAGAVEVRVRVVPRASRERIAGLIDDRVKVQIHAPPVEGEANRALTALLADVAGIAPSAVSVVAGAQSRSKTLLLECENCELVLERLRVAVDAAAAKSAAGRPSH